MKLSTIVEITDARIAQKNVETDFDIAAAFASDLMSEVLTLQHDNFILITGLANIQTIRTAEMADIHFVLFVRDKKVTPQMIDLATESGIILLETRYSLYRACGLLFAKGLNYIY